MKAVTLLLNSFLPPDLRDENRVFDKKGIDKLLAQVALQYPDRYADIAQQISDTGRHASYHQGETLTLHDFEPVIDRDAALKQMDQEVAQSDASSKSPLDAHKAKMGIWARYATDMEKATTAAALQQGNNLGNTVVSGARGNPAQLKAMVTTPGLYTDYKDQTIPMFVRHSFGEGLRPAEYAASAFGVRKGVMSTKLSTSDAGDLLKQMNAANAALVVTKDDCGTTNGLDFDTEDPNVEGRVLAKDYGPVKAGEVLDRRTIAELHRQKIKKIIVRSPLTCQAKEGICSHCLGTLPDGKFANKGYQAGITAASAIGEPMTQNALNTKHLGGSFKGGKKQFAGFDVIRDLVQSPETFPHKAATAESAGRVERIEPATQGGSYITVNGTQHYALPGYEPTVKAGDEVEAGDQLSEGIQDVSDIVRLRGLGEGRKYYVDRLSQALEESGAGRPNRLNLELLARGTLDHVRVDHNEGLGDLLPDDLASYNQISSNYEPAKDTEMKPLSAAHDHYLQSPVLHLSIGTKLTPKMLKHLEKSGISHVPVSKDPPPFVPEMTRLRAVTHNNPDWLARMHSSYLTTGLSDAAERARDADTNSNVHFAGPLMKGDTFGKHVEETGKF